MRNRDRLIVLDKVAVLGAGPAVAFTGEGLGGVAISVSGAGTVSATIKLEVTDDPSQGWLTDSACSLTVGGVGTATDYLEITEPWRYIRASVMAISAGAVVSVVCGDDLSGGTGIVPAPGKMVSSIVNPVTGGRVFLVGDDAVPVAYATKTYRAYTDAIANHATSTYQYLGHDDVDSVVFVNDQTGGVLRQGSTTTTWETQAAVTFSTAKGWPTGVTYADVKRILRFKNKLYLLAKDTADGVTKLWRASPASGNTVFTWEGPVISYPEAVSKGIQTALTCDDQYIYLAEYGDPTGGPSAWRSSDGLAWTECYAKDAAIRHIHAIEADPYNPGHLWMTVGDGVTYPVKRSTDYGVTWRNLTIKSLWQAVQISFTKHYVYLAGDSQQGVVAVVDRDTEVPKWASVGLLKNLPVPAPAALTDAWYNNAYYGIVDPASGVFYSSANDSSAPGNVAGLFCTLGFGQMPMLLDKFTAIQAPVYIFGGMVWCGKYRRPLL